MPRLRFEFCHIKVSVDADRRVKLDGGGKMSRPEALSLAWAIVKAIARSYVKTDVVPKEVMADG